MRLGRQHGGRDDQAARDLGVGRRATRNLVALDVPGLLRLRVGGDPGQGPRAQLAIAGHQFMHQAQFVPLARVEQLAFHDERLRAHQAQQARHLGDAGGAGDQAQGQLGQAELSLGVVHRDAVVRGQRHLPAAAQRAAVQARDDGNPQRLQRAEGVLEALDLGEQRGRVGAGQAHHAFQVGAGKKGFLGRGQDHTLELILLGSDLRHGGGDVGLPRGAHGVDGRARLVEGDGGDAIGPFATQRLKCHDSIDLIAVRACPTSARA